MFTYLCSPQTSESVNSGWHLNRAELVNLTSGSMLTFPCNDWISTRPYNSSSVTLTAPDAAVMVFVVYNITVYSSDMVGPFLGTVNMKLKNTGRSAELGKSETHSMPLTGNGGSASYVGVDRVDVAGVTYTACGYDVGTPTDLELTIVSGGLVCNSGGCKACQPPSMAQF